MRRHPPPPFPLSPPTPSKPFSWNPFWPFLTYRPPPRAPPRLPRPPPAVARSPAAAEVTKQASRGGEGAGVGSAGGLGEKKTPPQKKNFLFFAQQTGGLLEKNREKISQGVGGPFYFHGKYETDLELVGVMLVQRLLRGEPAPPPGDCSNASHRGRCTASPLPDRDISCRCPGDPRFQ